jgi:hypothetical protein
VAKHDGQLSTVANPALREAVGEASIRFVKQRIEPFIRLTWLVHHLSFGYTSPSRRAFSCAVWRMGGSDHGRTIKEMIGRAAEA